MKKWLSLLTAIVLVLTMTFSVSAAEAPTVYGDADGDGNLTILDATAIQYHLAGTKILSENAIQRCMVTSGSELTILDATAIQRRLAGLIDRFPVEINDNSNPDPELTDQISSYEQQVIRLINDIRRENGLSDLTADPDLNRIARVKSQDMHDAGYFDHTSPTYGTPFEMLLSFGVRYRTAGENIAYGYATPQAVVNGWMNSPGHRKNILNENYTKIGVGYVAEGNYWTQLFTG